MYFYMDGTALRTKKQCMPLEVRRAIYYLNNLMGKILYKMNTKCQNCTYIMRILYARYLLAYVKSNFTRDIISKTRQRIYPKFHL